jgi:hypothetical protein
LHQYALPGFDALLSAQLPQLEAVLLDSKAVQHRLLLLQYGAVSGNQVVDVVADELSFHKLAPQAVLGLEVAPKACQVPHDLEVLPLGLCILVENAVLLANFIVVHLR